MTSELKNKSIPTPLAQAIRDATGSDIPWQVQHFGCDADPELLHAEVVESEGNPPTLLIHVRVTRHFMGFGSGQFRTERVPVWTFGMLDPNTRYVVNGVRVSPLKMLDRRPF